MTLPTIRIHKQWSGDYRDSAKRFLVINGKMYRPSYIYSIWSLKIDKRDGTEKMWRGDAVTRIGSYLYRMGERVAKPLKLANGEIVIPFGWGDGLVIAAKEEALLAAVTLTVKGGERN